MGEAISLFFQSFFALSGIGGSYFILISVVFLGVITGWRGAISFFRRRNLGSIGGSSALKRMDDGLPTKCSRTIEPRIWDNWNEELDWDNLVLVRIHGILGNEIKDGYITMYVLLARLRTMNEGFLYS